jgi:hypothetical protein
MMRKTGKSVNVLVRDSMYATADCSVWNKRRNFPSSIQNTIWNIVWESIGLKVMVFVGRKVRENG